MGNVNHLLECTKCGVILKSKSSTSSLRTHLQKKHGLTTQDLDKVDEKISVRTEYLSNNSLEFIISKFAAVDRLVFATIARSEELIWGLKARGYASPPSSRKGVRSLISKFYDQVALEVKSEIKQRLNDGEKFSISTDEYTSIRNRRNLTLNVHFSDHGFLTLGMVRVSGTVRSSAIYLVLKQKLHDFGISIDMDIVACATDGAAVMMKFGRELIADHIQCQAHALHLAVCDFLYKPKKRWPG